MKTVLSLENLIVTRDRDFKKVLEIVFRELTVHEILNRDNQFKNE